MEEQIKELTLLLLYMTSWKEKDIFGDECMRSWKGYDLEVNSRQFFLLKNINLY